MQGRKSMLQNFKRNTTDMSTEEREAAKMNVRDDGNVPLQILHLPIKLIEDCEPERRRFSEPKRGNFSSFRKEKIVQEFEKESELSYPRDSFQGLKKRLDYNKQ